MTFKVSRPGIYKGINFRSQLEIKWAKFFDILKLKWKYEPVELSWWIPDFSLIINEKEYLVEIKPVELGRRSKLESDIFDEVRRDFIRNGNDKKILMGKRPFFLHDEGIITIGWYYSGSEWRPFNFKYDKQCEIAWSIADDSYYFTDKTKGVKMNRQTWQEKSEERTVEEILNDKYKRRKGRC